LVPEAKLEGGVPQTAGWFVVNAREARWVHNEMGGYCNFEGSGEARFPDLAVNLNVLPPGRPMAMYHAESVVEAFLVLSGECLLIVEGKERPLRAWDFFYCAPETEHVIVGAGDGPSLVLAAGPRGTGARYPVDDTAIKHGVGVEKETSSPKEAYAGYSQPEEGPPPDVF
jgi:uncharacterized cupin superfamily protein